MNSNTLLSAATALFLFACGDSGTGGTGGAPPSEPRWVCIHAGEDYCSCFYDDGTLVLSGNQYEIDSCSSDHSALEGLCSQGDDSCACIGFYCGADLEFGTCSCSTTNLVTPGEFTVTECTDYDYCCVIADTDLCFCGTSPCEFGDTEVSYCGIDSVAPVLDERDTENTYVKQCSEPPAT